MRVWDTESGRTLDVSPVSAAAGMLRYARRYPAGGPERSLFEHDALDILRNAATACEACGAYGSQPHAPWCRIAAQE
jgi:hypothetical protein